MDDKKRGPEMRGKRERTNFLKRKAIRRDYLKKSEFLLAWLAALAMVLAALVCSVHAQNVDLPFTEDSGAEFADESEKFDVPYVPTPMKVVNAMLKLASVGPNDFLIDLGSGDGRIVITAAKKLGVRGFGVDLNEDLVKLSKQYAKYEGVTDRAAFYVQDIFMTDLSKADVITMYLLQEVNLKLRPKLLIDLRPGTRVVSHDWHMGDWRPDNSMIIEYQTKDGDREESVLYHWIIPAEVAGRWRWSLPMPGGEQTFDLALDQHFQDIAGVATNEQGTWRLFNTILRGDRISFSLVSEADDRMIRQDYEGRIKSNVIEGTVTLGGGTKQAQLEWRASK